MNNYVTIRQRYERYQEGTTEVRRFEAPNDASALIFCACHLNEDDMRDFLEDWKDNKGTPLTLKVARKIAKDILCEDGDDFTFVIKNVTTGKTIYENGYVDSLEIEKCCINVLKKEGTLNKNEKTAILLHCVFTEIQLASEGKLTFPSEEDKQEYLDQLAELAKAINDKHYEYLKKGE